LLRRSIYFLLANPFGVAKRRVVTRLPRRSAAIAGQRRSQVSSSSSSFEYIFAVTKNTFVAISSAGPNRALSKGAREQPFWDEHEVFIDQLVEDGFILMGGPLVDERGLPQGALLIVNAEDENEVKEKLKNDPWLEKGILKLESVKRWEIFIDAR
jgi:uncharacterized protein YciI